MALSVFPDGDGACASSTVTVWHGHSDDNDDSTGGNARHVSSDDIDDCNGKAQWQRWPQ